MTKGKSGVFFYFYFFVWGVSGLEGGGGLKKRKSDIIVLRNISQFAPNCRIFFI